jgi:hypothetical protein
LSIRPKREEGEHQLKVKYYLEGFPEPQILLFDMDHTSHRENIAWVAQDALFAKDYAPSATVDIEALLVARASETTERLNWEESIVDLMKLLKLDSSLGARKRLAQQFGYTAALDGSAEMNNWLYKKVIQKIRESGGDLSEGI